MKGFLFVKVTGWGMFTEVKAFLVAQIASLPGANIQKFFNENGQELPQPLHRKFKKLNTNDETKLPLSGCSFERDCTSDVVSFTLLLLY